MEEGWGLRVRGADGGGLNTKRKSSTKVEWDLDLGLTFDCCRPDAVSETIPRQPITRAR